MDSTVTVLNNSGKIKRNYTWESKTKGDQSSWYSLGVVSIYDKNIHLSKDVGFNWARTKDYRDRLIKVTRGAKAKQYVAKGEYLATNGVVIYPNLPFSEVLKKAKKTIDLTRGNYRGWMGVISPNIDDTLLLTMANLEGREKNN